MMMITAKQKIITAPGESSTFEPESSLNLVNPPPPEGIDILLSAMVIYFNNSLIILPEFL